MTDVFIHRLETLVPQYTATQDLIARRLGEWSDNAVTARMIRHVFQRSGIERRYSVIPDFTGPGEAELFRRSETGELLRPSTRERMQVFGRHAGPMAVQLARRLLDGAEGFRPEDVTHIITVSCTGFENPGPDLKIVTELGLPPGVERYHLGFMGCYAALPALRMARQFCLARPEAVVLIVALELCSLHMQMDSTPDSILGNALFSDGAAAALVSSQPPADGAPALLLNGFGSALATEGHRDMAWEIGNLGFHLRLSSYVPDVIGANVSGIAQRLLEPHLLSPDDIDVWAVHPGGKTILDRVAMSLALEPGQIDDSRSVLRDFGNMSSATILFVLRRILESTDDRARSIAAMAFGPGLTIESALLERVPAHRGELSREPPRLRRAGLIPAPPNAMPSSSSSQRTPGGPDAEVVIAGAGPVGLLLANQLGARGVRTIVCDLRTQPLVGSMAIGVTPPSLEILRPLGLDTVLRDLGVPVRFAEVHESRRRLGRLDFAGIPTRYPFFLSVPQERTVELLHEHLRNFPSVRLRPGWEFEGSNEEASHIRSRWHDVSTGLHTELRSGFVVGCDGHRSAVREAAGLTVRQRIYPQRFVMGDFLDQTDLGDEARLFFAPEASVESFPLPGGWRRWILLLSNLGEEEPVPHLIRNVRRLTGYDLERAPVRFVSAFGAKRMVVDRYHAGRVFLAGDAAHVMSSIGGQGMNTGFADAEMLAEILPRLLHDPAALAGLAATYDRIRRTAFEVAATRAERGMWLGTLRGRMGSMFRRLLVRWVLFGPWLRPRLAPHFAMLTVPFCNLSRMPAPVPGLAPA